MSGPAQWLSRRDLLLVAAGAGLAGQTVTPDLFTGTPDLDAPGAPWPIDGGSARRDGYVETALGDEFETVWETAIPAGGSTVRGLVVGADTLVTNEVNRLVALDAHTGERRWTNRADWSGYAMDRVGALSLVDGTVVFATDTGPAGADVQTGDRRWNRSGRLYRRLPLGDTLLGVGEDAGVGAYDPKTGVEQWHVSKESNWNPIVAGDGRVVCLLASGAAGVVDVNDRTPTQTTLDVLSPGPTTTGAYGGGLAFLLEHGHGGGALVAFDPAAGEVRWRRESRTGSSVITDGETVYLPDPAGDDGTIRALDATTGDVRWERQAALGRYTHSPVCTDERLVVNDGESLLVLDSDDGSLRNRIDLRAGAVASGGPLAVAHDRLYVVTDTHVVALEVA
ncbi:PQQ-binding-like beta-propeller repeat protein [Haloarchaeobius sp. DFWS5]|uniref:outer membrane protein assembly factor BamB family protein n=1 Tax=Haloarchaeobius sp. DFWS5 TaxID=3446114 RepID=UPI003EB89B19